MQMVLNVGIKKFMLIVEDVFAIDIEVEKISINLKFKT